jgi:hypothetical protein
MAFPQTGFPQKIEHAGPVHLALGQTQGRGIGKTGIIPDHEIIKRIPFFKQPAAMELWIESRQTGLNHIPVSAIFCVARTIDGITGMFPGHC